MDRISAADIAEREWLHGNWTAKKAQAYLNSEPEEEWNRFELFLEYTGMLNVFREELSKG